MENIMIGTIVRPVGLKGDLKVLPRTNSAKRFKELTYVIIDGIMYNVNKVSVAGEERVNVKLNGIDTIEQAETLRNKHIYIKREDAVSLNKDEYFVVDLINAKMFTENGQYVGTIQEVDNYGANDIITFFKDGVLYTMAYVNDLFLSVNTTEKKIIVSDKINEVMCEI